MQKVVIATPIHRVPHPRMVASRTLVRATCQSAEVAVMELRQESLIDRARNTLLSEFRRTDADWVYFWDDDLETENTGGDRGNLLDMLLSHGKPFIGGLYSTKGEGAHCAARALEQRASTRLWPMKYLAGGSMLVHRDVIDRLIAAHAALGYNPCKNEATQIRTYALFQPFVCNNEYLSEDFAFCERWRAAGGEVYADLDVRLNHWGEAPYTLLDPRSNRP